MRWTSFAWRTADPSVAALPRDDIKNHVKPARCQRYPKTLRPYAGCTGKSACATKAGKMANLRVRKSTSLPHGDALVSGKREFGELVTRTLEPVTLPDEKSHQAE